MFEQRITEAAEAVEEIAATVEDPWEALAAAMASVAERQARDRGTFEAVKGEVIGSPQLREARARIAAPFAELLGRAQEARVVRDDLRPEDVLFLISAAGHAQPCRPGIPDPWWRYLGVVLDGMRPASASPLPGAAPSPTDIDAALEAAARRGLRVR